MSAWISGGTSIDKEIWDIHRQRQKVSLRDFIICVYSDTQRGCPE
jgi:hypothetical protein